MIGDVMGEHLDAVGRSAPRALQEGTESAVLVAAVGLSHARNFLPVVVPAIRVCLLDVSDEFAAHFAGTQLGAFAAAAAIDAEGEGWSGREGKGRDGKIEGVGDLHCDEYLVFERLSEGLSCMKDEDENGL